MYLQVKVFDDVMGGHPESECNEFLKKTGDRVKDVSSMYNTILGGIVFVVTYYE